MFSMHLGASSVDLRNPCKPRRFQRSYTDIDRECINTYARRMTEDQGSIGIDGSRWAGSIYANNNRLVHVRLTVRVSAR